MAKTDPTKEVASLLKDLDTLYRQAAADQARMASEYTAVGIAAPPQVRQAVRNKYMNRLGGLKTIISAQIDADTDSFREDIVDARRAAAQSPDRLAFYQAVPAFAVMILGKSPSDLAADLELAITDGRRTEVAAMAAAIRAAHPILPAILVAPMETADQAAKPPAQREAEAALEALEGTKTRWGLIQGSLDRHLDDVLSGAMPAESAYSPDFVLGVTNDSRYVVRPQAPATTDDDAE